MKELEQFIIVSRELKALLEEDFQNDQREKQMNKIDELLQLRQKWLKELSDLSQLASQLDEKTKLELVHQEKEIQTLMQKKKNVIKQDIKTLQLKKQKNDQYANPYENLAVDGMFLDKKK
ncbi:hypothetical protein ABE096_21010 [Robertmurraya massiliosenegalensis]|uniref:hypothetical protein n=1 Tax=Robertmurraya TaxID=2837507 RepID=UPI0039A570C1